MIQKFPFWYRQNTLLYTSDERLKLNYPNLSSPLIDVIHPKAYNLALSPGIKGSVRAAASIPSLVLKDIFPNDLVVFLTYGTSLDDWKNAGLLTREIKLYKKLSNLGWEIILVTYGDGN